MTEQMHNELNRIWESTEKRLASIGKVKWTFWSYDVWGNDEEGYTVNDRTEMCDIFTKDDSPDIDEINDVLTLMDDVTIDNGISTDEIIELISGDDEKPYGQLVRDTDEEISDIGTFLSEDVLEITREQYLSDGKWETKFYTLVLGTGGPHTEFNTNGLICVYWGGEKLESTTYDSDVLAVIEQIEDDLRETTEA
jgi:hypothetical protein